jgi:hypothetical protein
MCIVCLEILQTKMKPCVMALICWAVATAGHDVVKRADDNDPLSVVVTTLSQVQCAHQTNNKLKTVLQ